MRNGPLALGALIGICVGMYFVHQDRAAQNERYSYAMGYDDARHFSTAEQCQRSADIGTPLLDMRTLDLDAWATGCAAGVEAWRNRPPMPVPDSVGAPGPPGMSGT